MTPAKQKVGPLRTRLVIQSRVVAVDSFGSEVEQWSPIASVMGNITPLSGRELWNASQVQSNTTHQIDMRYLAGVLPSMRVVAEGVTYSIQSAINPDGRKRWHLLTVVQEVK